MRFGDTDNISDVIFYFMILSFARYASQVCLHLKVPRHLRCANSKEANSLRRDTEKFICHAHLATYFTTLAYCGSITETVPISQPQCQ
jgi:hypothetical protein